MPSASSQVNIFGNKLLVCCDSVSLTLFSVDGYPITNNLFVVYCVDEKLGGIKAFYRRQVHV